MEFHLCECIPKASADINLFMCQVRMIDGFARAQHNDRCTGGAVGVMGVREMLPAL